MGFCGIALVYTFIIMLGSMSFGLTMTFWSPAATLMSTDLDLTESQGTVFNILAPIGGIAGGLLANVAGRFGRRRPLFVAGIVHTIGWVLIGITKRNFKALAFVMRATVGVTMGVFSSVCPLYITELAPVEYRGVLGTFNQLGIIFGSTLTYFWGVFFDWRIISYLLAVPPALLCFLIWFVIESPAVGRLAVQPKSQPKESLCARHFVYPLISSALLMFFQQFSGINALLSNLQSIFDAANVGLKSSLCAFLVGMAGTLATATASYIVKRLGRKVAWFLSCGGMSFSLLGAGFADKYQNWPRILPIIFLFLANLTFGFGLGPVPWFLVPDLFPDSVRATAMALMTALNWVLVTTVMLLWPYMKNGMGTFWSFLLYAFVLVGGVAYGILMMTEAKIEADELREPLTGTDSMMTSDDGHSPAPAVMPITTNDLFRE
jgi:MFS family permease